MSQQLFGGIDEIGKAAAETAALHASHISTLLGGPLRVHQIVALIVRDESGACTGVCQ
jgi:hypothetical protein